MKQLSVPKPSTRERLVRWIGFSVVFPLIPLLAVYGKASLVGPPVTLTLLVARGGLLILSFGLSAGAIADLLTVGGDRYGSSKMTIGVLSLVNLLAAAIFYTVLSDAYTVALETGTPLEQSLSIDTATVLSLIIYLSAVVMGGVCIFIATLAEKATLAEVERASQDR